MLEAAATYQRTVGSDGATGSHWCADLLTRRAEVFRRRTATQPVKVIR
jgi:hypothetical protein